jgi:predicted DNA-binding transcriptional regulator AlpA
MTEPAPTATPPMPAPSFLVNAREAARLCGVGRSLWLQLNSSGRTPAPIHLGRRILWNRDELIRWCGAGCQSRDRWETLKEAHRGR